MLRRLLSRILPDVTINPNVQHDTWHTCPSCNFSWKDPEATRGLIHSTKKCNRCRRDNKEHLKFDISQWTDISELSRDRRTV